MEKLGLVRNVDLALHLPMRYEDETQVFTLRDAVERSSDLVGASVQFNATVVSCDVTYRGRRQLVAVVEDDGLNCELRYFNFYPSLHKSLEIGKRVRLRGELKHGRYGLQMLHPAVKAADAPLAQGLTPVYPSTAGVSQPYLRKAITNALQDCTHSGTLTETIPTASLQRVPHPIWTLPRSLTFLHSPPPDTPLHLLNALNASNTANTANAAHQDEGADSKPNRAHPAWDRLVAEELLAQQLSQQRALLARKQQRAQPCAAVDNGLYAAFLAQLPFALTAAQQRVTAEILRDMAHAQPMHRLLQGDVGAGKTVVATLAACAAIDAGQQCVLMAPTEILARQHFHKISDWLNELLAPLGKHVAWLAGSQKKKEKQAAIDAAANGAAALLITTHAVLQETVQFANLGLAIVDEQHRFGVQQRLALKQKMARQRHNASAQVAGVGREQGVSIANTAVYSDVHEDVEKRTTQLSARASRLEPHYLMMTATPIPRTLAMSYYADLDVSTIDELPPGRTPVVTRALADSKRDALIARLDTQLNEGRQAYWVCPLIEESEALDLANATETHALLQAALPQHSVALLHARMSTADKQAVMQSFSDGDVQLLVSTTVIEVGVDVPNASIMVIEHPERFGLSQLHQLRGRVGRGSAESACVLLYGTEHPLGATAKARLSAMTQTNDGFEIARIDLEIRGPGEFLGARQSGAALLRFADLQSEHGMQWLEWAQAAAADMLINHTELAEQHVARWLGNKEQLIQA